MSVLYQRLLLATEHGTFDSGAETLALALARHFRLPLDAVLPLASNAEFEALAPQWAARAEAEASTRRQSLLAGAAASGVALSVTVRRGPEAYAEIVAEARARGSDLIVIRRRGQRGVLANLLVGDMVSKVVAHAPCSVLVAPRGCVMWQRRVLLGLHPLQADEHALARAIALAAGSAAPLHLACVLAAEDARGAAQAALADAQARAAAAGVHATAELCRGPVHQALLDAAARCGADLIVVGRHRADSLPRAWIGGVVQKVVGLSTCPVLVHLAQPNPPQP